MGKLFKSLVVIVLVGGLLWIGFRYWQNDGSFDRAGEQLDKDAEVATDAVKDATKAAAEKTREVVEDLADGPDDDTPPE